MMLTDLPAEQYAIQTGQHPAITTINNIDRYREQLDKIGFCFDWSREIRTGERNIIGLNGHSRRCSTAIIAMMKSRLALSKN